MHTLLALNAQNFGSECTDCLFWMYKLLARYVFVQKVCSMERQLRTFIWYLYQRWATNVSKYMNWSRASNQIKEMALYIYKPLHVVAGCDKWKWSHLCHSFFCLQNLITPPVLTACWTRNRQEHHVKQPAMLWLLKGGGESLWDGVTTICTEMLTSANCWVGPSC